MEFTDYMWLKAGVVVAGAFIYGVVQGIKGRSIERREQELRDTEALEQGYSHRLD